MPTVQRNAPNLYNYEGFTFYPGINQVPDDEYKAWEKKPNFHYFKQQLSGREPAMIIIKADKVPEGTDGSLAKVIVASKPEKAIELIKGTLKVEVLEEVLHLEKRKKVIDATNAQLEEMKRKPSAEELLGGPKASTPPPTGNLMDNLNIAHDFKEPDKY